MAAEYNCAKCDKSYVRRGNLEKHMAKHTELEGGVQQGDTPLFADIVLPEDFPDLDEDYLALMDVADVNFDDPFCGRCSDESDEMKNLKLTNNKLLRKVIALEKSLKIARKLCKDAKNETESARFMLEKATRESLVEKQKAAVCEAVPELFGKYPTRPVPKSKTPTRQTPLASNLGSRHLCSK